MMLASRRLGHELPPGPTSPPFVQTIRLLRTPQEFLAGAWRRYGDLFRIRIQVMGDVVVTVDPALVKNMLVGDASLFLGGAANQLAEPMIGPRSLFLTDGSDHEHQRRLLLTPFHHARMRQYENQIRAIAVHRLDALTIGRAAPVRDVMQAIAMDVILQIVFGLHDNIEQERMRGALEAMRGPLSTIIMLPWLRRDLGPMSPWPTFLRRRDHVDALIRKEIAVRRLDPLIGERNDILSLMLTMRDAQGEGLPESEIRDQLLTLVTAGFETTATGLAWAVERLSRHPDTLAEATARVDDDRYLGAVVQETLRVRPPLYHIARRLGRPWDVDGYTLPAGIAVMIPILLLHQRPDVFSDPLVFRPERFLDDRPAPFAWLPFGGGLRRCVGIYLAQLEMRIALQEFLRRFRVRSVGTEDEPMTVFHVTLVPKYGARVELARR